MASELEFSEWLGALVRQNEREPMGYPERLELEQQILQAFKEAKEQERRAWEALHNQIESQKDDWEKAITSLRKAAEENAAMRALLERWHELSQTIGTRDYSFNEKDDLQEATRVFLGAAEGPASG